MPKAEGPDDETIAGKHLPRDTEQAEQLIVPVERPQVHELGSAGVGHVRDMQALVWSPGQVPDHPGVDRAEHRSATLRGIAYALDVIQDPAQLRGREVGGGRQPGSVAQHRALRLQSADGAIRPGVLPDERVVPRAAGRRIPYHRRFTLIGHADGNEVASGQPGGSQGASHDGVYAGDDFERVVFDQTGTGQDLPVLELMPGGLAARPIEHHESRAGGSLIEGPHVPRHHFSPGTCVDARAAPMIQV